MAQTPWIPIALLAAAAAGCSPESGAGAASAPRPNVVLFVIDTLRADHLGCYGYGRETSPNLDALAADGVLFERCQSHSPYTATSHATLFTSTYQGTHGLWNKIHLGPGENVFPSLNENCVTLAEALADGGYETAAFADGGMLLPYRKLDQGFATYDSRFAGANDRVDRAIDWLAERKGDAPFFLFVHTYQVHLPYLPPEEIVDRFDPDYDGPLRQALREALAEKARGGRAQDVEGAITTFHRKYFKPHLEKHETRQDRIDFMLTLYDAELAVADAAFGRLMEALRKDGLLDDTLVVVTSDHGEEFWEHGRNGHYQVYEELLHVPLIVRAPGGPRGLRRADSIGLIDLAPTILAHAGLEPPARMEGRTIRLGAEGDEWSEREMYAVANYPANQRAYRYGERKAVLHPGEERESEAFDLAADPHEQRNVGADADWTRFLDRAQREIQLWRQATREKGQELDTDAHVLPPEQLDPAARAEIEELGYTGS